jgi:hypothetical protein
VLYPTLGPSPAGEDELDPSLPRPSLLALAAAKWLNRSSWLLNHRCSSSSLTSTLDELETVDPEA